jgi:hypothetical protein
MHRTENAISTAMGAAKEVEATFEGVSGIFKELMREHGEIGALLMRVAKTTDTGLRRERFPELRVELVSHEKGELAVLYPVFRQYEDLVAYAEMHEREAGALERMIQRLDGLAYEDIAWGSAFAELVQAFSHHVKEEESDYFPFASKTLGKKVTETMTAAYRATKKTIIEQTRS